MRILGINSTLAFERRPKKEEEAELRSTINQAYKVMGTTDRVVITHGSCFPALERDTFIGSPYGKSAREYSKFLMLYGFNGNQLGPGGELGFDEKGISRSPYSASAFANNRLFIDLEELTTEKYGKILPKQTYNKVTFEKSLKTVSPKRLHLIKNTKNFSQNIMIGLLMKEYLRYWQSTTAQMTLKNGIITLMRI